MKEFNFLIAIILILFYSSLSDCIATYSIDLSSEFIKVAIVKPGVPMEIALNGESQRKTPAVVFIRGSERLFGEPAMSMGVKYPKNLYHSITTLVGKTLNHTVVKDFIRNFPYYDLFTDDNDQLSFRDGKDTYTIEELLAMILANGRHIAEIYSEMSMKGGIIVVPPYFTQDERHAVIRAAEIGGLNVMQLINSNTAVGLNYGIFRRKSFNSTAQYYMFYDVGASATVASIIGYQVIKTKERGMMVENPQLSVVGIGYDRTLGATQFTLRLQRHLAKAFNAAKKTKTDVTTVPRSMAKLFKEAGRLVKVLSANNQIYAQIENVLDDQDFKLKITRTEFEEMCGDLFERFSEPIHKALESAQIPMPVIKEIILMGGGTRVPKIQEILLKTSDREELGKGINTDEAAALGAVYQAAFISPGFKVQHFLIKDSNLVPISVDFLRYKIQDNKETYHPTTRMLFDLMNPFPQKKVLTFNKHQKNFDFNVTYGSADADNHILCHVSVDNMTAVFTEHMKPSDIYITQSKGVKAHFGMDNSGLFALKYIEAIFERKLENENDKAEASAFEKFGNTISNFFGSSSKENVEKLDGEDVKKESKTSGSEKENNYISKNATEWSSNDTIINQTLASINDTSKNESVVTKPTAEVIHQNVHFITTWKSFVGPTEEAKEMSRQRILKMKSIDDQKVALEKAKNELESYIFEVKSRFEKEMYVQCSTETERTAALEESQRVSEWYEEQGVATGIEEFTSKYNGLSKLMRNIDLRVRELSNRPESISKLNSMLNTSNMFLDNLYNVSGDEPGKIFTKAEYESLARLITDTTKWFANTNKTLESMQLSENPKIMAVDFERHIYALEREIGYLLNKISVWRNQTPPTTDKTAEKTPEKTAESNSKTNKSEQSSTEPPTKTEYKDEDRSTGDQLPPLSNKKKEERVEL